MRPLPLLAAAAAVALLAGCAAQSPTATAPLVTSQVRPKAAIPPAWGVTQLGVRAALASTLQEVAADCSLESPYSTARFTTPARVSVPDLGPETPVLRIACSDGTHRGTAQAQATLRSTNGGLGGWPAVGVSVGTGGGYGGTGVSLGGFWGGGWGTSGPSVQQAVYPDVQVLLQ